MPPETTAFSFITHNATSYSNTHITNYLLNIQKLYNRERLYSIGIILYKELFLFSKKLIELVHKGVNILELAINRRKTDI